MISIVTLLIQKKWTKGKIKLKNRIIEDLNTIVSVIILNNSKNKHSSYRTEIIILENKKTQLYNVDKKYTLSKYFYFNQQDKKY